MDASKDQTTSPSPDSFFGSVDPVAFAFAIVASILASLSLMDQSAEATRKGAVLSVVKGMRLMFIPEAVDSLHLHGDIWTKPQLQHFLIRQPGLISLMIRHPCGWKSCPAMDKANLAYNDFVNLSCIKVLDDFEGTMKMMFLIRWHISALRSYYTWYTGKPKPISEAEFNKELDEWFLNSLASCTDMTEEEMEFLEKLACMRMLRWNRFVGDDTTKFAWEVPRQRKYTNLWFILGMKAILRTDYPEGNYTISGSGAWASVERVGMTWHMRSGSRRQGFWTTCRIWDLEEKQWQQPGGRVELDMNPELTCMNQLATPILDFGNCVNAGPNALFFIQTEKSLVNDLIHLINTLDSTAGQIPDLAKPDDQLASHLEIHRLGVTGIKGWCRCNVTLRSSMSFLCCVPVCTIFLRDEAIESIASLPRRASGHVVYMIVSRSKEDPAWSAPMDSPIVKKGEKDIFTCMLVFRGKVIIDIQPVS